MRIGLTGGIGSGKSTVASMLARLGGGVIDADAISRDTTASAGAAIPAIAQHFGAAFITADGALDRVRMRALVFQNASAKDRLEAIVHPLVVQQIDDKAIGLQAAGNPFLVFDIPLLVESKHWRRRLDRVLVVDCSAQTQMARVIARSQLSAAEVQRIIAAQATRQARLSAADWVLHNDALSLDALALQVKEIAMQFGL